MRFVTLLILFLSAQLCFGQASAPPQVAANTWLLVDYVTGQPLLEHEADRRTAEGIQLAIEYDPRPPFDSGSTATARS